MLQKIQKASDNGSKVKLSGTNNDQNFISTGLAGINFCTRNLQKRDKKLQKKR